jgi:hypothetical protein
MLQCALNHSVWFVLTLKRLKLGRTELLKAIGTGSKLDMLRYLNMQED